MSNLEFPSDYKSEITVTQEYNAAKSKITLLSQNNKDVLIRFNNSIFPLYQGNSLSLTDKLSNTYFGFIKSVDTYNETALVVVCIDTDVIPDIVKVEYYEWWSNKRPAATILNYIFITEPNG